MKHQHVTEAHGEKGGCVKPYFETENGKLYHGDCMDILPHIEPVDLVLTDPPYGINIGGQKTIGSNKKAFCKEYGKHTWDKEIPSNIAFELMFIKSKHQIIFGGNYFVEYLKNSPCWIVWDKQTSGNFADCELAWTNFKTAVRKFEYLWNGMIKLKKEKRYHPTQKPVGLFTQILLKYSEKNQTVLDPFLGSGTTALACEELNRKWIGIEISEKYCEIAAKRIENETKQMRLF